MPSHYLFGLKYRVNCRNAHQLDMIGVCSVQCVRVHFSRFTYFGIYIYDEGGESIE